MAKTFISVRCLLVGLLGRCREALSWFRPREVAPW